MKHDIPPGRGVPGDATGGQITRIGTALGTFLVEIVNDLGPAADELVRAVEADVIRQIRVHRGIAEEMDTIEVQRGALDLEVIRL